MMHIGLFLDRDGTINEEVDYLSSPHQVRLIPRAADAIREAKGLGFKVVVISNQSGVARGMFTETDLKEVNSALIALLSREQAQIDALYYCPHHPDGTVAPYNIDCDCRKPGIGMLKRAAREFDIDLSSSYVVGDRMSDIEAGRNAHATSILVLTGYGKEQLNRIDGQNVSMQYVATDLYDAFQQIKRLQSQKETTLSRTGISS